MIHISLRNNKLGSVPNISLPPGLSCIPNPPCADLCYAKNFYISRKQVRKDWDENYQTYCEDPMGYFIEISKFLSAHNPKYFRWHVGGDIPTEGYLEKMHWLADKHRGTRFLAYTKRDWISSEPNLILIHSHWIGWDPNQRNLDRPHAMIWMKGTGLMIDTNDPKHPPFILCPGKCAPCGHACWYRAPGDIVIFKQHGKGIKPW